MRILTFSAVCQARMSLVNLLHLRHLSGRTTARHARHGLVKYPGILALTDVMKGVMVDGIINYMKPPKHRRLRRGDQSTAQSP